MGFVLHKCGGMEEGYGKEEQYKYIVPEGKLQFPINTSPRLLVQAPSTALAPLYWVQRLLTEVK